MRKLVFVMALIVATGTMFTSCKSDHKEEPDVVKDNVIENDAEVKEEMNKKLIAGLYQCPMDCEKGKTYEEPGKCPVCKMDLKLKESEDDHEGHDHD
jgi:hypothetical protein